MNLRDLPTPALILDKARLTANLSAMSRRMKAFGVDLRPHMKTAKSAEVARLAVEGHSGGITVSTLAEAEYFAEAGFRNITYAVGIVPAKLDRVAALRRAGVALSVITDEVTGARALVEYGAEAATDLDVLIEIDTGSGRAGVTPEGPALQDVAETLGSSPHIRLKGVLTHAGKSYAYRDAAGIRAVAAEERDGAVTAARRLRSLGFECPVVSVGSTPTAVFAENLAGVTEARPGVYMFGDLFQAAIGTCRTEDIAVSVLSSVIGHRAEQGRILIDAGALALSQDRSMDALMGSGGLGAVFTEDGSAQIDSLRVVGAHQEHGFVEAVMEDSADFDPFSLPLGARIRVFPNHACMTAAQFRHYHVVEGGGQVADLWHRCQGW